MHVKKSHFFQLHGKEKLDLRKNTWTSESLSQWVHSEATLHSNGGNGFRVSMWPPPPLWFWQRLPGKWYLDFPCVRYSAARRLWMYFRVFSRPFDIQWILRLIELSSTFVFSCLGTWSWDHSVVSWGGLTNLDIAQDSGGTAIALDLFGI